MGLEKAEHGVPDGICEECVGKKMKGHEEELICLLSTCCEQEVKRTMAGVGRM